jgi:hypothetical protein
LTFINYYFFSPTCAEGAGDGLFSRLVSNGDVGVDAGFSSEVFTGVSSASTCCMKMEVTQLYTTPKI